MTTLIEKLERLCMRAMITCTKPAEFAKVNVTNIRHLIEEHKWESSEPVGDFEIVDGLFIFYPYQDKCPNTDYLHGYLYTSPQPSHTQLIGELVQVLDDVGAWINTLPAGTKSATAKGLMIDALLAKAKEMMG